MGVDVTVGSKVGVEVEVETGVFVTTGVDVEGLMGVTAPQLINSGNNIA